MILPDEEQSTHADTLTPAGAGLHCLALLSPRGQVRKESSRPFSESGSKSITRMLLSGNLKL
jgi:hypothetical protein